MSNNIVLIAFFAVIGLTWIEALPTRGSEGAISDADSPWFREQKHFACGENEHYNNTRQNCEEYCHGRNGRTCFMSPLPCWCNESYVRNSSLHCVKIEDCLKDEEQKSEILTSSALKSAPNPLVLHTPLETVSQVKKFIERIDQDIPHLVFGKTENPSAENQPLEIDSRVQKFNGALDQKILDLVFGKPANFPAENNNREYGSRIPEPLEGTDEEPSIDLR